MAKFNPFTGTFEVVKPSSGGTGDMTKAVYDPTNINSSAFNQDNMVSGTTNKDYTASEQTKLAGIAASATVGADWNSNLSNIPSVLQNKLTATANVSITAGYGAIVTRKYLINSGIILSLGLGSRFRIL
jgi:hypothetical protein